MAWFGNDLRYGLRVLRRTPVLTLVAVLTLALGIGANTAIFSVIYSMLLRPLSFSHPEQLVVVAQVPLQSTDRTGHNSYPDYLDWKTQSRQFQQMGTWCQYPLTLMSAGEEPRVVSGAYVSSSLFATLAVPPVMGRVFTDEEARPNGPRVAVVSQQVWREQLGGGSQFTTRTLHIDGEPYTVIGVMPDTFRFPLDEENPSVWLPEGQNRILGSNGDNQRSAGILSVLARLKPGISAAQADAAMAVIGQRMAHQYPDDEANTTIRVTPLRTILTGNIRPGLLLLLAAVACLLLVACVNVASLLLARATERQQEIAIRAALGASQGQVMRQLLVESLLLSLLGGAAGILLAAASIHPLLLMSPGLAPGLPQASLSMPVLLFTLALSLATGLIFGILPARQVARTSLTEVLNEGGRSATSHRRSRVFGALVAAETALAMILLIGAALLIQSFWNLMQVPLGWNADHLLVASVMPAQAQYSSDVQMLNLSRTLLSRSMALPGVQSAALAGTIPLGGARATGGFDIPGRPKDPSKHQEAIIDAVSPLFFSTLDVPLLRGRLFLASDTAKSAPVAIISQSLAHEYWPGQDPVGHQIASGISDATAGPRTIVGVVGDMRWNGRSQSPGLAIYLPFEQVPFPFLSIVLKSQNAPLRQAADVRHMLASIDPSLTPESVQPMDELLARDVAQPKFQMTMVTLFAVLTLLLAAVGTAGVVSYGVTQRTREIAIRMALGAETGRIARMVMSQTLRMIGIGLMVGVIGYLGLNQLLVHLLYGMKTGQAPLVAAAALVLTGVATIAIWIPTRRAMQVDPMTVLRQ